jgi:hypothetical protein
MYYIARLTTLDGGALSGLSPTYINLHRRKSHKYILCDFLYFLAIFWAIMYNKDRLRKRVDSMNLCKYYDCYGCFTHASHMNICGTCPCNSCIRKCKKARGHKGTGQDHYKPP